MIGLYQGNQRNFVNVICVHQMANLVNVVTWLANKTTPAFVR